MLIAKPVPDLLELSRLDTVEKYAALLTAEIVLAKHCDGFFDQKHWHNYLDAKYQCQEASNKFYILLHELSK